MQRLISGFLAKNNSTIIQLFYKNSTKFNKNYLKLQKVKIRKPLLYLRLREIIKNDKKCYRHLITRRSLVQIQLPQPF